MGNISSGLDESDFFGDGVFRLFDPLFALAILPPKHRPIKGKKSTGRNDPCPCGSRNSWDLPKKYKHCCLRNK